jgi:DNA-binding FrmR family transcriptional regulator
VRAALRKVGDEILRDYVENAIKSGNEAEQRSKVAELMAVFARAER